MRYSGASLETSMIELPSQLPIFPLTGTVLLPGMMLPLNIFEPRYRNMVADTLAGDQVIGMIQPLVPQQDNQPVPGAEPTQPELYSVGCVGLVENHQQDPDGNYKIVLRGLNRFHIQEELPIHIRGYRVVVPDYSGFESDIVEEQQELDCDGLLPAFIEFAEANGRSADLSVMEELPCATLTNGLAMMLPFAAPEKQALLEADSVETRMKTLFNLFKKQKK